MSSSETGNCKTSLLKGWWANISSMLCIRAEGKPIFIFNKCCCFQLRTAVLIIASLEIIATLFLLGIHVAVSSMDVHHPPPSLIRNTHIDLESVGQTVKVLNKMGRAEYISITIRGFLHGIVFAGVSCILIYGVKKNRIGLMKVWIWVRAVNLLDDTIDQVSIGEGMEAFLFVLFLLVPISIGAMLLVRSYIFQLTHNDNFVQLNEIQEDA